MSHGTSKRSGFTLVELLVLLTIIGVLVAVLFPVFSAAIKNAHRTSCQSNLKQLGVSLQCYVDENSGCWPAQQPYTTKLLAYAKTRGVFKCPGDPLRNQTGGTGSDSERISYMRNSQTFESCTGGSCWLRLLRSSMITRPSRFVVLIDEGNKTDPGTWSMPRNDNAFRLQNQAGRHQGLDNYLLADGHVQSISSQLVADGDENYGGITWDPTGPH